MRCWCKLQPAWCQKSHCCMENQLNLDVLLPKPLSKFTNGSFQLLLKYKQLHTTSVSLHTETWLHCLTIQVLNTGVCFINIWYTSLTSVHYNLEHGLVIVTETTTTSFVKVQTRSDMTSNTIPNAVYLSCTLNWLKLVCAGSNQL